jgi:hypothetical protein
VKGSICRDCLARFKVDNPESIVFFKTCREANPKRSIYRESECHECNKKADELTKRFMTWRTAIQVCMAETTGETWQDLIAIAGEDCMDKAFDDGFGSREGEPFTAWSENWVYFPKEYDGLEEVCAVRRNPCDIRTEHV